jgi:alkanesulfonate monooxygenase SsuD/methylene tetrahydromethanopterin reductase-like flavin-dependent oxidoreductase (luciferase family)
VLAAQAATIDNVSKGRLEFAIGAAWFEEEHRELGIPFPANRERIDRLDEAVQVIRALWTGDDVSFDGRYYRLDGASHHPKPVQAPHPPIWIGASGEQLTVPLAGRHADVWHGFGSVESLTRKSAILDRAAKEAGRDPASILRSSALSISEPLDEVRSTAEALRDAGFRYLTVSWPEDGRSKIEQVVHEVLTPLR